MAIINHHHGNHRYTLPKAQTGAALLALMLVVIIGSSYFLVTKLNINLALTRQSEETGLALNAAKDALIGYAVAYPDKVNANFGPGYLPCPDRDNNGSTDPGSCSLNGNTSIGRFPYKTVGSEDLRDGHGERLWYVVSDNFRNNPKLIPLNSETAGNASGDMTVNGYADIAAVIFAAEAPENNQNRTLANKNDYTHYIEATFTDSDIPIDGILDRIDTADTDRYILLTRDELMQAVEKRVLGEASQFLTTYVNTHGAYPWLTPFADPKSSMPPLSGEHDGGDGSATLSDSSRDFNVWGVAIGDVVRNLTDGSIGMVTGVIATTLTIAGGLSLGTDNLFDDDDEYYIYPSSLAEVPLTGSARLIGRATNANDNDSLEDTNNDFNELDITLGDIVDNITDGSSGVVDSVSTNELTFITLPNTLTLSGGTENDFDNGDNYRIRSQHGQATAGTNGLTLEDTNNDFVVMGVQIGDLIVNHTDGSIGRVSEIDSVAPFDTLSVNELLFGTNNSFTVNDYYSLPRYNAYNNTREGLLTFHEVGKHFPTALNIDWNFTTAAAADISFDAAAFPGVQATYSTALTNYLGSYAEDGGTQSFDNFIGTCIWLLSDIADCYGSFKDFVNISGTLTSGSDTVIITDTTAEFNTKGIKRGDIAQNYDDELSVVSGIADIGSAGTTLVDTGVNFSAFEPYSYVIQNNTLEIDLSVARIQGVISEIIDADTLVAVSYVGQDSTPIEFRVGDSYTIFQPDKTVVTSVTSETQLNTDNYTSATNPDFDSGEYYRVMPAANSYSGTVTNVVSTGTPDRFRDASADFLTEGISVGDIIENTTTGAFGEIIAVITDGIETTLYNGTPNDFTVGDSYTVYHDYVFSREHIFHAKFRGNQGTNTVSEERVRDVCLGYSSDCSTVSTAVSFSGNGGTSLITLRDYEEDETTEVGRATFTPTSASSGSIRVSNIDYYLADDDVDMPQWLIRNNWHQLIYIAYDGGDSPSGGTDCVPVSTNAATTNPCLTLTGGGSPNDNKRALIISAGEPLSTQDRTLGITSGYYENENNDAGDDDFKTGAIISTFNDQVRILDTSP